MSSYWWIKLYIEILQDSKMMRMPEILFARCIKLFLLAGKNDKDGELPSLIDIAWELRISEEEAESDLIELQKLAITANTDGVWRITKWDKRQGPMTEKHRSRLRRQKQKMLGYEETGPANIGVSADNRPESDRERDRKAVIESELNIDIDIEEDKDSFPPPDVPIPKNPPAIRIYKEVMNFWPAKEARDMIVEIVGNSTKAQERWRQHLINWKLSGYRKANIEGILESFASGGLRKKIRKDPDKMTAEDRHAKYVQPLIDEGLIDEEI